MTLLLDLLYIPAALLYLPVLLYQMIVLKKNRRGWRERLGGVPRRKTDKPCIWIHAVSLGEVNATQSLVAEIERRLPDYEIVISTTTDTGFAAAQRHYEDRLVFRYPLDFSFAVKRTLRRIRPNAIVLMELEVWPNLIHLAARNGIPVGVANGRVTAEKSMRRFQLPLVGWIARRMFSRIAWIAAQNEAYAARFETLGARRDTIAVAGSLKYDTALIASNVTGDVELAVAVGIDRERPLVVAGSTGPGEEERVLDAFSRLRDTLPDLQLAIIPRKPERFDDVARLIRARGHRCVRRTARPDRHPDTASNDTAHSMTTAETNEHEDYPQDTPTVILGDTMGELRKFYALADVVFVGRTLVPLGGSDLMEVAALARPTCFGPHTENFADVAEELCAADAAIRMDGASDLVPALRRLLKNNAAATEMGSRAQDIVRQNTGATKKTVDLLCQSLTPGP